MSLKFKERRIFLIKRFIFISIFIFIFLACYIEISFGASVDVYYDSNGNIDSVGATKISNSISRQQNSSELYDCQKLGNCLLDYDKIQALNDSTFFILKGLIPLLNPSEQLSVAERILILKETRFACEMQQDKLDSPASLIALSYPFKGPNSNKSSQNYDLKKIENLIEIALLQGVDPFLVLGILVTENPPIAKSNATNSYEEGYGKIPVDGTAIYDFLGCKFTPPSSIKKVDIIDIEKIDRILAIKSQRTAFDKSMISYNNPKATMSIYDLIYNNQESLLSAEPLNRDSCFKVLKSNYCKTDFDLIKKIFIQGKLEREYSDLVQKLTQRQLSLVDCYNNENCKGLVKGAQIIKKISLLSSKDSNLITKRLCNTAISYNHGGASYFAEEGNGNSVGDCCVDVEMGKNNSQDFILSNMKNIVAANFINSKIKPAQLSDLSLSIQKYNGLGCFGCTEKATSKGSCMDNLDMKKTPVYGAKVADIMLNMLMNNPKIIASVKDLSKKLNKPIKSIFCSQKGNVKVNNDYFLNQQKDFLLNNGDDRAKQCLPLFK